MTRLKRTEAFLLAALVSVAIPLAAAATGAAPPDATALGRAAAAFELRPGVLVDPMGGAVYLMRPEGTIEKVSVASGEMLWTTAAAANPLALHGDLLIAQSERTDVPGILEIAFLDALAGGERRAPLRISLPPGVRGGVDEALGRSFVARAVIRGADPLVTWEQTERYTRGVAPEPGEPLVQRQAAAYRLDVAAGRATAVDAEAAVARQPALPPGARAWADSTVGSSGIVRAGSVFAAPRVRRDRGGRQRITLSRWDAARGVALPEVDLFRRPHVVQFPSANGRHLLVSERANPGEFEEYQWSIFSLETGERLGRVSHHRSHAWFFVSGETLVFVEPPYGRLIEDGWVEVPRRVRAVLLGSDFALWQRPLRDTAYRGPFPP